MRSRKVVALALFLAMLLVILIPLIILESRRTPDWQAEFERYLETSETSVAPDQLVEVAEAQHPEYFDAQLLIAVPTGWPWGGIDVPPPEKVRCVRIGEESDSQHFLVGYHSDGLWHMGWLVHEFCIYVSEEKQQALLAKLGCVNWMEVSN
ncbi:MAG: hypothetical protein JXR84_19180 [Anaerolineae bacterium]|nr:hypothetical protein [Anaerolineae bacterium]